MMPSDAMHIYQLVKTTSIFSLMESPGRLYSIFLLDFFADKLINLDFKQKPLVKLFISIQEKREVNLTLDRRQDLDKCKLI